MRIQSLSIRSILLLTISALTLIIVLLAAKEMLVSWRELARIQSLTSAVVVSDQLFDATEKLAEERDIVYTVLYASDKATILHLQPRLEESAHAADIAFSAAMEALKAYDFPEIVKLRGEIKQKLLVLRTLRQQVLQAVAMPVEERNRDLSGQWFDESTALIVQTQDLWVEFSKHFADIDPIVTQHLRYKHFLRVLSDYTGRERAIIGRIIVAKSNPTPQEFAQLLRGQGIIELSWKFMRVLANQSSLDASIKLYFTDAHSHYLNLYGMIRGIFYAPDGGRHGMPLPITVELWLELSAQAKESLNLLKDESLKQIRYYVELLKTKAQRTILMHSLLLLFALSLCLYSFWVIAHRVIRPINAMVRALLDTVEGKPVILPAGGNSEDEIGKLGQVLHAFQQNMEKIRQATAKAIASDNKMCAVVDNALNGIITINERGTVESFNPACERLFGYKAAEVIGQNVKMLMPEPYHGEHDGYLSRYVKTGDAKIIGTAGREVAAKRKDGSIFPMELSVCAFQLEDGRHFSGIINDITQRKEAEANMLIYTHALERSNKELDDFAYIASHDLKEPLRGLFNHATFLLEDYKDKLDERGVYKLHRLSYLSQRMEQLVNDLLYFSRIGRQELAIQPTDMNEVIRDIKNTLDVFIEERHAHITVPNPLPTVICDKVRITEAFRNLITNAIKYNDKPEKSVEIGFKENHVLPDGQGVRNVFYVRDDGRGIAAEFYEEIFRIFKRLQSSKDGQEEGTGAGLTFVKKIIERHGGKIWPESEVGKGTTFYVALKM